MLEIVFSSTQAVRGAPLGPNGGRVRIDGTGGGLAVVGVVAAMVGTVSGVLQRPARHQRRNALPYRRAGVPSERFSRYMPVRLGLHSRDGRGWRPGPGRSGSPVRANQAGRHRTWTGRWRRHARSRSPVARFRSAGWCPAVPLVNCTPGQPEHTAEVAEVAQRRRRRQQRRQDFPAQRAPQLNPPGRPPRRRRGGRWQRNTRC